MLLIRQYTVDDRNATVALHAATFRCGNEDLPVDEINQDIRDLELSCIWKRPDHDICLVGMREGRVIAMGCLSRSGEISRVRVHPDLSVWGYEAVMRMVLARWASELGIGLLPPKAHPTFTRTEETRV